MTKPSATGRIINNNCIASVSKSFPYNQSFATGLFEQIKLIEIQTPAFTQHTHTHIHTL